MRIILIINMCINFFFNCINGTLSSCRNRFINISSIIYIT
nr:MAG TPA: hypothetical protein [Bacteriophage sp.]